MTWEETIEYIRGQEEYEDLVRDAYFDPDLEKNVERYYSSPEYAEIKKLIARYTKSSPKKILDLGAGNGISSVAFAQDSHEVIALEPDSSKTIGAGAIQELKEKKALSTLTVIASYAEDVDFENNSFDLVFARQSMHHANELNNFIGQASRVLKPGGILFTVRDHVIDQGQLDDFLEIHPLHKYYGGEHAYTLAAYREAFEKNGLSIELELKPYDSPINYAPFTKKELIERSKKFTVGIKMPFLFPVFLKLLNWRTRHHPGRMYSFICRKSE